MLNCLNNSFLFVSYDNCRVNALHFCSFHSIRMHMMVAGAYWDCFHCKMCTIVRMQSIEIVGIAAVLLSHCADSFIYLTAIATNQNWTTKKQQSNNRINCCICRSWKRKKMQRSSCRISNNLKRYGNSCCFWHRAGKLEPHHECAAAAKEKERRNTMHWHNMHFICSFWICAISVFNKSE